MTSINASLERDGYVVLPSHLPAVDLPPLLAAARRARSHPWPHVRTVGKQFPPWPNAATASDVWGLQHIMHPDLGEPLFSSWYGSDSVVDTVREILGCDEECLQLELCGILVNPQHTSFELQWHRDEIKVGDDETVLLDGGKRARWGTQWNTALVRDECLEVVPGSHRRVRTEAELRGDVDGIKVVLQPGDSVFYDHNILHRAVYPTWPERLTLHACMGRTDAGEERRRNILQHRMAWVKDVKFEGRLEKLRMNLVGMGVKEADEVGYSLED